MRPPTSTDPHPHPHPRPPKPPSLEDVAQRAGVSTATVSRVLNSPDKVAPATAERVREAIAFLDYRPNQFASGLMTRSSRVIGLVVADDFAGVTAEMLTKLEDEARRLGFHLLLVSASRLADADAARTVPALGMIDAAVTLIGRPDEKVVQNIESLGVPLIRAAGTGATASIKPEAAAALLRRAMHAVLGGA